MREVREVARPLDDDQLLGRRFDVLEEGYGHVRRRVGVVATLDDDEGHLELG